MQDIVNDHGRDERETVYSQVASQRDTWHAFTDDPVSDRLLRKRGAVVVDETLSADGKHITARTYQLDGNQISVRSKSKPLTDAQKKAKAAQAAHLRALNAK